MAYIHAPSGTTTSVDEEGGDERGRGDERRDAAAADNTDELVGVLSSGVAVSSRGALGRPSRWDDESPPSLSEADSRREGRERLLLMRT